MTVVCPICKNTLYGFTWQKTVNEANWMQNEQGDWHDCPMNQKHQESTYKRATKYDYEKCEFCGRFILIEEMSYHLGLWHKDNEILTDDDFRVDYD